MSRTNRDIKVLSDKEHILLRPNMYIGSVKPIISQRYIINENKIKQIELKFIPGLVKIFEEILDNSVDAFVDNNFKSKPKIDIEIDEYGFCVTDNGVGIPNKLVKSENSSDDKYMCEIAWGTAKAGSNFEGERKSAGANGIGSYLTTVFSSEFIGINESMGTKVTCKWNDNTDTYERTIEKSKKTGVTVLVRPDFSRFKVQHFRKNELLAIESRIKMLAITYPEIKFLLNGTTVSTESLEF
jgi:DNA topoisomerase-2